MHIGSKFLKNGTLEYLPRLRYSFTEPSLHLWGCTVPRRARALPAYRIPAYDDMFTADGKGVLLLQEIRRHLLLLWGALRGIYALNGE